MSEPDLSAELRRRAEASAAAMIREAEAEARRISADARDSIRKRQREVLRDREEAWRAEARSRIAAARHEAMKEVLLARTRVVERVLEKARALLPGTLGLRAYLSFLAEDVDRALQFIGDRRATVRCTPGLSTALRDALTSWPAVKVEPADDIASGFVAVDERETVRVDCTLETRLDRLAPQLAIEIHRRLAEHAL